MIETKNVLTRARRCATCHVGSAENDVNHDLLAAGHPPLRFEMASYQALLARKHWDDSPRRLAEPNYEVQLWSAGRLAAHEATLALLLARAKRAAQHPGAPWPEFAEWNCFSCHQSLRPQAAAQPSSISQKQRFGLPLWQTWNLEFAPGAGTSAMAELRMAMQNSLLPAPEIVARLAALAGDALPNQVRVSAGGILVDSRGQAIDVRGVLESIDGNGQVASWEFCCHKLAALIAAERAIRDRESTSGVVPLSSALSVVEAGTTPDQNQFHKLAAALRFADDDREWPAALRSRSPASPEQRYSSLDVVAQELEALRSSLIQRLSQIER